MVYRKYVKEQNYENESMNKKLWLVSIDYKDHRWLQFLFLLSLLNILIGKNSNDHELYVCGNNCIALVAFNYSSTKMHNHDFGEWIDKYNKLWDKNNEEFELFLIRIGAHLDMPHRHNGDIRIT